MTLQECKKELIRMSVNKTGSKKAPHKAILLLAIIDLIEEEMIDNPFIPLSVTLIRKFEEVWKEYVPADSRFQCKINYPFYHLASSPFWELIKLPTFEERQEYSLSALKRSFAGAVIKSDLFALFQKESYREEIRKLLIDTYLSQNGPYPSIDAIARMAAEGSTLFIAIITQLIA